MKTDFGLRPLDEDKSDITFGALFRKEPIPDEYQAETAPVKDQGNTDHCTSYGGTSSVESWEDATFCPQWTFAVSKMLSGDRDDWGQTLRWMAKAGQKYGFLPLTDEVKEFIKDKSPDFLRDINNWPDHYFQQAYPYRQKTYTFIRSVDELKQALYKNRDTKRHAVLGLIWAWPIDREVLELSDDGEYGHAIDAHGYKTGYIRLQNSYGTGAGDNGFHWASDEVIQKHLKTFGAIMFIDEIEPSQARWYSDNKIKVGDSRITIFLKRLIKIIFSWFS